MEVDEHKLCFRSKQSGKLIKLIDNTIWESDFQLLCETLNVCIHYNVTYYHHRMPLSIKIKLQGIKDDREII